MRGTTNEGHGSEGIAFLLLSRPRYILTALGVGGQSSRNIHQRDRGDEEAVTGIPRARVHPPDRGKHDPGRAEGEREAEEVVRKEVSQVPGGSGWESMGGDEMISPTTTKAAGRAQREGKK